MVARVDGSTGFEFIEAEQGEADFRVADDRGMVWKSMTEDAARHWAAQWNAHPSPRRGTCHVETRIVGATDWALAGPASGSTHLSEEGP